MDDLKHAPRLPELNVNALIHAKMERRRQLVAAIEHIDKELAEARLMLVRLAEAAAPPPAPAPPAETPRKHSKPVQMPRVSVVEYLRQHGPASEDVLIRAFNASDQSRGMLRRWANRGILQRKDGMFWAPGGQA